MKQTYSDQEIEALENSQKQSYSDAEINAMEQNESDREKYPDYQSALVGAGDVATAGYGPNLISAAKNMSFSSPEYIAERDRLNKEINAMRDEDPNAFLGGQVLGAGATAFIPGGAISKGVGLVPKLARAALIGGSIGAMADTPDPLGTTADPFSSEDLSERGKNAAIGAVLAPVAEVGVSALKKVIPNSVNRAFTALQPDKAARTEARLAGEKATSILQKDINSNVSKMPTKENLVKFAKDEGILEGLPDVKTVYDRTFEKKLKYGKDLRDVYEAAQLAADKVVHENGLSKKSIDYQLNLKDIGQIKNQLVSNIENHDWADVDKKKAVKQISSYFDNLEKSRQVVNEVKGRGGQMVETVADPLPDILELHEIKSKLGDKAYTVGKVNTPKNTEKFWREAARTVDEEIKKRVDGLADLVGKSDEKMLGDSLRKANHKYSFMDKIYNLASHAHDSHGDSIPTKFTDIINSPGMQMALSNTGKAIESRFVPSFTGTEIARGAAMAAPSAMRPASDDELQIQKSLNFLPPPHVIDKQIKDDDSLTPSQKFNLRKQNSKGQ